MFIVEVTGISGVGKSYVLNLLKNHKENNFFYDTDIVDKYNLNDFKLFYIFLKLKKMLLLFRLIVKIALKLNFNYLDKINFVRNTIKKIAKNHFFNSLKENKVIIVDEGISHLYQNIIDDKNINSLIVILVDELVSLLDTTSDIILIDAVDYTITSRLLLRGHKRMADKKSIDEFVSNSRVMIKKIMKESSYNIVYVKNENGVDEKELINSIEKRVFSV